MAIDAALGRLGIKSGVCTSSTRPTNPYSGQLIYETDTNRTLVYDNAAWVVVADNQVLSIDATNGRVGVGTTLPDRTLHVDSPTAAVAAQFSSQHPSLGLIEIEGGASTATAQIGVDGDDIVFRPLVTERVRIDSSGNVGIGTTTPAGVLHVVSNSSTANVDPGNYVHIDRPTTSYESGLNWSTNGVSKWFWGTDNDGTDNLILYDWLNGKVVQKFWQGGQITASEQPAFYAWKSNAGQTPVSSGETISFPSTTMNRGNHYNTSTSLFTAPVGGVYYFSLRVLSGNDASDTDTRFKLNGTVLNTYSGYGSTYSGYKQSILSGTIYLSANDTLGAATFGVGDTSYGNSTYGHTSFSGFLIG